MKNIFNFFNRKADYTAKKNDLANDAISFVVDEHKIYVKDQWFGGSGDGSGSGSGESTVIENPYDDTEVRGLISDVNSRLDNLVLLTQQDVQNTVTSMIADMRSFIDNFGWDAMFNDSGWDEEMRAYIQTVGFTDSENNQVSWSQFYQDFKTLQSVVSQINIGDTDEDINYETIQAMINSTIDGNTAINEIKSKWALAAENEKVLKWLASGFAAQANQGGSFAQVYAAGQNANTTAISALETRVDNVEDNVDSNTTAIASLSTRVDNAISGLVTQAALNNATSAIYSQLDGVTASIATAVKKDANGRVTSSITFGADNVALNENGSGYLAGGNINWDTAGNVNMNGEINATSGTIGGWKIGDKTLYNLATLNDGTNGGDGIVFNADRQSISVQKLTADYSTESDPYTLHDTLKLDPREGFTICEEDKADGASTPSVQIKTDGSGFLANGNFNWTEDGIVSITGTAEDSQGLPYSVTSAQFNNDGSGSLANGNLSWDKDGKLSLSINAPQTLNGVVPALRVDGLARFGSAAGNPPAYNIHNPVMCQIYGLTCIYHKWFDQTDSDTDGAIYLDPNAIIGDGINAIKGRISCGAYSANVIDLEGSLNLNYSNINVNDSTTHTEYSGYTGTINGAKFVNGICVGAA